MVFRNRRVHVTPSKVIAAWLVIAWMAIPVLASSPARADAARDCSRSTDPDRQIRGCTTFIARNPKNAKAYNNRGIAYGNKGDSDRAIADFTKAIALDPKSVDAYNNRAVVYVHKGDSDQAIVDYTKAIALDPKYVDAYTGRGIAYDRKGNGDQAIADLTKAIALDPKRAGPYNNRGVAYDHKGDRDQAIVDFTKAIALDPKYVIAFTNRGLAYHNKGDHDQAIADFTKAIALDPKRADAYNNRGLAYEQKGDKDRAIADFREALARDPNRSASAEGLKRLGTAPGVPPGSTERSSSNEAQLDPAERRKELARPRAREDELGGDDLLEALLGDDVAQLLMEWAQMADAGKTEYLSSCGTCHGSDGKGSGPMAGQLKAAPTDLTQLAKKNGGVFPVNAVYERIDGRQEVRAHGSRDMPVWGHRYTPSPNLSPNQAFNPKPTESYLDLSYDPEVVIRGRILALVDYLNRIQEK